MAGHVWERDNEGRVKTVDSDNYPYCMWVICRECDGWFCNNGCDQGFDTEECEEASRLKLFDVDARGEYVYN